MILLKDVFKLFYSKVSENFVKTKGSSSINGTITHANGQPINWLTNKNQQIATIGNSDNPDDGVRQWYINGLTKDGQSCVTLCMLPSDQTDNHESPYYNVSRFYLTARLPDKNTEGDGYFRLQGDSNGTLKWGTHTIADTLGCTPCQYDFSKWGLETTDIKAQWIRLIQNGLTLQFGFVAKSDLQNGVYTLKFPRHFKENSKYCAYVTGVTTSQFSKTFCASCGNFDYTGMAIRFEGTGDKDGAYWLAIGIS